jgi:hypothetical protein
MDEEASVLRVTGKQFSSSSYDQGRDSPLFLGTEEAFCSFTLGFLWEGCHINQTQAKGCLPPTCAPVSGHSQGTPYTVDLWPVLYSQEDACLGLVLTPSLTPPIPAEM